jgi:hypothetical protein
MVLQDIMFSMPFANSEASTITPEDLRELSEFEKSNPGQVSSQEQVALFCYMDNR